MKEGKTSKKKLSKQAKWIIGIAVVIIAIAIIGSKSSEKPTKVEEPTKQEQEEEKPKYVFDVPALIGKNIDEVKTTLGTPTDDSEPTEQQLSMGTDEWSKTFEKDGKELLVTYNPSNRQIIDFFISTDDPSGKTQDKNHLLELGNLKEGDSRYKIEFVKTIKDPSTFTGVKAIPVK